MPLTCSCGIDDYDWYYTRPSDYSVLGGKRRKRCSSCHELIDLGAICTEFLREREVRDEVEERIFGECERIYLASHFLCEECSDLWFSLDELGFECISPDECMRELVREYARGRYA